MPHKSFGAVRQGVERAPITFDFGIYGEETFTVNPDPSIGDTFDLHDAPEPNATNELESVRVLARFIRRLLKPEDKKRFDEALYRIPSTEAAVIIMGCAEYIVQHIVPFALPPAESSSAGRPPTGSDSKILPDGT